MAMKSAAHWKNRHDWNLETIEAIQADAVTSERENLAIAEEALGKYADENNWMNRVSAESVFDVFTASANGYEPAQTALQKLAEQP